MASWPFAFVVYASLILPEQVERLRAPTPVSSAGSLSQQLILGEIIVLLAVSFLTVRDENEPNLWQDGNLRGNSVRALIKPLAAAVALAMSTSTAHAQHASAGGPPAVPVYPPYSYKAGHYPTAEAYYDLPPYAATNPSFYRWRFFMIGQERNRYRYMPHIFHGYSGYPEDTVSSSAMTPEPVSEPMSPNSPPKAEPSPAAPTGVLEPKKEDAGSSGEPGPAGSTSPQAPGGPPPSVPGPSQ